MKNVPGTTNVSWSNSDKSFRVTKWLNGKQKTLGSYPTLIGALMIRDWCQANDWKPYHRILSSTGEDYITIHNGAYEIHKRVNGKLKYFGRYHTLEDAKKWRDYFIENNWDINLNLDGSSVKNILLYNGKFQVRKKIEGHLYYFGCYDTLEEARVHPALILDNQVVAAIILLKQLMAKQIHMEHLKHMKKQRMK